MPVLKFKDPITEEWKMIKVVSDGVTFIPSISDEGVLTWTNDGNLDNPDPTNITNSTACLYDSYAEFPSAGSISTLYIDRATGSIYRWDEGEGKYIGLKSQNVPIDVDKDWEDLSKVKASDVTRLFDKYYGE